jgi:hypothetical protein
MSRSRLSIVLFVIGGIALAAAACTPPATTTTTTTSTTASTTTSSTTSTTSTTTTSTVPAWVAAGCLDGAGTDGAVAPDLKFNGLPNQAGNATFSALIAGSSFSISGNGTCSGQAVGAITIVRAADQSTADGICSSLGQGTATAFAGTAWTLPADAYSCSNTIAL